MDIQLFTSGLDSFLAAWRFKQRKHNVERVYFNLQGMYNNHELRFLRMKYDDNYFEVMDDLNISNFENEETAHVPNRNLLLVTLAQSRFDADTIFLSGVADDRISDNDFFFYQIASNALTQCAGKDVQIKSILGGKEKAEWCRMFANDQPEDKMKLLTHTYSCFDHHWNSQTVRVFEMKDEYRQIAEIEQIGCGRCPACYRRLCAISAANLYVPVLDRELAINYVAKIDPAEHPNRHHAARYYADFIEWLPR